MNIAITALGTATPIHRRPQTEVVEFMCNALNLDPAAQKRLHALYRITGIHARHSVLSDYTKSHGELSFFPNDSSLPFPSTASRMQVYRTHALPLALQAIADCGSRLADFDLHTITHLITSSCTGMYAPGLDIDI